MTDLLGEVLRCDMCAEKKERRNFLMIADGDIKELTLCTDCGEYLIADILQDRKTKTQEVK